MTAPFTDGVGGGVGQRIRTVEYDPGWGWIARCPWSGFEIMDAGFRWASRSIARAVVNESRVLGPDKKWIARQRAAKAEGRTP